MLFSSASSNEASDYEYGKERLLIYTICNLYAALLGFSYRRREAVDFSR